ncbi:hypothetical protein Mal64_06550 [Pseudobythopirellula maris]|uniref:Uncharacterized protein n=1 Tax=Pseudobythopirellula maris TaxID=2527991 RepID=A0A5C5ZSP0_9BACT|nr:hypothetical protein Mal64_06550 [Pseudobythopirellula maris]
MRERRPTPVERSAAISRHICRAGLASTADVRATLAVASFCVEVAKLESEQFPLLLHQLPDGAVVLDLFEDTTRDSAS